MCKLPCVDFVCNTAHRGSITTHTHTHTKIQEFSFSKNSEETIKVTQESAAEQLSFEWSHCKI